MRGQVGSSGQTFRGKGTVILSLVLYHSQEKGIFRLGHFTGKKKKEGDGLDRSINEGRFQKSKRSTWPYGKKKKLLWRGKGNVNFNEGSGKYFGQRGKILSP